MEGRVGTLAPSDGSLLAGRLAMLLAEAGEAMLADALTLLVACLGVRSAVLRDAGLPGGELRAVAGEVVHAVPTGRVLHPVEDDAPTCVELPVRAFGQDLALLTVVGARPVQLPALRACAAVIALVLASGRMPEHDTSADVELLLAEAADRDAIADDLHDGPVQALVVARYAADAAVRGSDPTLARDGVQAALVVLRRTLWHLRPRGTTDLAAALCQLDERLREGERHPLDLRLDTATAARLSGAAGTTAYRFVQAAALTERDAALVVSLRPSRGQAVLEVASGVPALARWELRFRALGATTTATADGVRVAFALSPVLGRPASETPLRGTPLSPSDPKATP